MMHRVVLWAIRPLRLFLLKVAYNVSWLVSLSHNVSPRPGEKSKSPIGLRELAEQLGLLLHEYPRILAIEHRGSGEKADYKKAKEGAFWVLDDLTEAYADLYTHIKLPRIHLCRRSQSKIDARRTYMLALRQNPMVRLFLTNVYQHKRGAVQSPYVDFISRKVKRWKELTATLERNEPKLLCRICEQTVALGKFMVSCVLLIILGRSTPSSV